MKHSPFWLVALVILGLLVAPRSVDAQQSGKVYRIGWLGPTWLGKTWFMPKPFLEELRKLGWVEGQHFVMEYRPPGEKFFEELSTLATELTRLPVDVIVTSSTPAALTAKRSTDTIPIVMAGNSRPVKRGLIASLAQPEGNVTGLTNSPGGGWNWPGKRMELLQEAVPQVVRVGILASSLKSRRMSQEDVQAFVSRWQTMAQSIGLTAVPVIVYRAEDFPQAFALYTMAGTRRTDQNPHAGLRYFKG